MDKGNSCAAKLQMDDGNENEMSIACSRYGNKWRNGRTNTHKKLSNSADPLGMLAHIN